MSRIEKRKQDRYPLERQPDGEVFLRTPVARYPIKAVNDVSSSGISIFVDGNVDAASQVAIEYIDPKIKIEVNGTVAWCAPREAGDSPGRFMLGIELLSPLLLLAVLSRH